MNIRELLVQNEIYAAINREERNLAAILYHALLLEDNLQRFLKLINCTFEVKDEEWGIYFEYAYIRDSWSNIGERENKNEIKRNFICEYLNLKNSEEIKEKKEPKDFNEYFGAVPISAKYIQSPGRWNLQKLNENIKDDNTFLKVCMFKWAFNAKPDIVVHTSKDRAICIEAKFESGESSYPQNSDEKAIFDKRFKLFEHNYFAPNKSEKKRISQTNLQKYLMEELLGINTDFVLIQKSVDKDLSRKPKRLTWSDVFKELNLAKIPHFMNTTINKIYQDETKS